MNQTAILSLLGDLYAQVQMLLKENEELKAEKDAGEDGGDL